MPHTDQRHDSLRAVACDRCAAVVLAAKFSAQHTSVQWDATATASCAEFSLRAAEGERTALIDGCASLAASIEAAISDGRLAVAPP